MMHQRVRTFNSHLFRPRLTVAPAFPPNKASWQRDLSLSFERIGDEQSARGDLDRALQAYQEGLAIAEKLAAQDPGNTEWQRDLIVSYIKLAEVAEATDGQTGEAEPRYRSALDVALTLRTVRER